MRRQPIRSPRTHTLNTCRLVPGVLTLLPPLHLLRAESEVCKLETLLQTEVSVVTTGEAAGADGAKTPPSLRRRKRTCSRRQSEREGGGAEAGERGERGVGEERNRREASKCLPPSSGQTSHSFLNSLNTFCLLGYKVSFHNS